MASIKLNNICKQFADVSVLNDIQIEIADEEMVVLVGPSGCGKSTLLRIICGLETANSGEILFNGSNVNEQTPKERNIAMVFQTYALYPHMNVRDNMSFSLKIAKVDPATIEQQVRKASEILHLEPYLDRYPRQLSGGQRQRVAMGRAIVRDPVAFLFDEPLSNLDAQLRVRMRAEIKELHQRLKTTSVFVTHDQVEAMTMADRIAVMRDGVIEQIGAPLEIYDNPVNSFVGKFIGSPSMNIIEGALADGTFTDKKGTKFPLGVEAANGPVILGVRPEDVIVTTPQEASFTLNVGVVEITGNETIVYGTHGETEYCVLANTRLEAKPGDLMPVALNEGKVHLFKD
jgi:multiple sugar transport system ATP-binding protein